MVNLMLNAVLVSLIVYFMYYKSNQMQEGMETFQRDLASLKVLARAIQGGAGVEMEKRDNGRVCYCVDRHTFPTVSSDPSKTVQDQKTSGNTSALSLDTAYPSITQGTQRQTAEEVAVSGRELVAIMEEVKAKNLQVEPFEGDTPVYCTFTK